MKIKVLASPLRLPLVYNYFYNVVMDEALGDCEDDEIVDIEFVRQEARKFVLETLDQTIKTGKDNVEYPEIAGHLYSIIIGLRELITELTYRTSLRYVDIEFFNSMSLALIFDTKE